jgi:hypothetical protein
MQPAAEDEAAFMLQLAGEDELRYAAEMHSARGEVRTRGPRLHTVRRQPCATPRILPSLPRCFAEEEMRICRVSFL